MDLAHGLGGGGDLPISASAAVLGGSAALIVSFAVLTMAWRRPRYDNLLGRPGKARPGRPAPGWIADLVDAPWWTRTLRMVGLVVLGFALWCGVAGPDDPGTNPVFGLVYVVLWVGLVPGSLLLGPVVKALSPLRTLHLGLSRMLPTSRRDGWWSLPGWVGRWPAAAGLVAFAWVELIAPGGTTLPVLAAWFAGYAVVVLAGAVLFGPTWFARADPFEAYSTLVAHLSPWSRDHRGRLEVLSPLHHLSRVEPGPGLLAVVSVLLGSTAFDSYRESASWLRFTQANPDGVVLLETLLLVAVCMVLGGLFWLATSTETVVRGIGRRTAPSYLAHSVVPIVVGYMTAHYLTLLVETGQSTLIQASDPLGRGWNLFGTAERNVDLWLSLHPGFLATVKVLAIVLGHLVGVVAAHDRSLALLPPRRHVTGQLPLLAVMVAYTFGGLYLLFGL
ncbi:MAG: hypothetical protein OSB43_00165 [Nocardioides sp.]|uniref:hypothetical protein n=1 Tax=Nocardioides sp. TaxID=35761 RepID=UPI000C925597|nr:hypothetical protein [Nocardioides sp.]MAS55750.1 hypothetical protein [Pimelobacter sp.]MDE0774672.1 hypothetical protein [Nocardioides sp.]